MKARNRNQNSQAGSLQILRKFFIGVQRHTITRINRHELGVQTIAFLCFLCFLLFKLRWFFKQEETEGTEGEAGGMKLED